MKLVFEIFGNEASSINENLSFVLLVFFPIFFSLLSINSKRVFLNVIVE